MVRHPSSADSSCAGWMLTFREGCGIDSSIWMIGLGTAGYMMGRIQQRRAARV